MAGWVWVAPVAAIKTLQGPSSPVASHSAAHQENNVVLLPSLLSSLERDRSRLATGFEILHLDREWGHFPGCSTGGDGAGGGRPLACGYFWLTSGYVWLPIW